MANRKRNIQMNFYVTENKKRLIDERIKLLASLAGYNQTGSHSGTVSPAGH